MPVDFRTRRLRFPLMTAVLLIFLAACSAQEVEVTRVAQYHVPHTGKQARERTVWVSYATAGCVVVSKEVTIPATAAQYGESHSGGSIQVCWAKGRAAAASAMPTDAVNRKPNPTAEIPRFRFCIFRAAVPSSSAGIFSSRPSITI